MVTLVYIANRTEVKRYRTFLRKFTSSANIFISTEERAHLDWCKRTTPCDFTIGLNGWMLLRGALNDGSFVFENHLVYSGFSPLRLARIVQTAIAQTLFSIQLQQPVLKTFFILQRFANNRSLISILSLGHLNTSPCRRRNLLGIPGTRWAKL